MKGTSVYGPANYRVSYSAEQDRQWKFAKIRSNLSPWYRACTKTKFIWKGCYGYREPKNVILESLQRGYLRVRSCKLPGLMQRRIRPTMEICGKSGLPFSMEPCLHQSKVIRRGSYGDGEPKNVILESVSKGFLRVRACKLPGLMQRQMRPTIEICGNSGLPFSIIPCLHQSKVYSKRKLQVWRTLKCSP